MFSTVFFQTILENRYVFIFYQKSVSWELKADIGSFVCVGNYCGFSIDSFGVWDSYEWTSDFGVRRVFCSRRVVASNCWTGFIVCKTKNFRHLGGNRRGTPFLHRTRWPSKIFLHGPTSTCRYCRWIHSHLDRNRIYAIRAASISGTEQIRATGTIQWQKFPTGHKSWTAVPVNAVFSAVFLTFGFPRLNWLIPLSSFVRVFLQPHTFKRTALKILSVGF